LQEPSEALAAKTARRPDDAAAVNAIVSGSQHSTISAISHRMARYAFDGGAGAPQMKMTFQIVVSFRLPV
jgi:hypothetical protein